MASLLSEALDFALTKAGKDSDFKLNTEQNYIIVTTAHARVATTLSF